MDRTLVHLWGILPPSLDDLLHTMGIITSLAVLDLGGDQVSCLVAWAPPKVVIMGVVIIIVITRQTFDDNVTPPVDPEVPAFRPEKWR